MTMTMVKLEVNGYPVDVVAGSTVIQACQKLGFTLPRYCYDERLLIAGNCRMCLVEVAGSPKPQVACALPVSPNMKVFTDSPRAKKARELVTDFLLIHHPLDCPICDQAGECDLQDQTFAFGSDRSRYYHDAKRGVEDKNFGPIVATAMTRCIHCTRCVRYMSERAGVPVLGTIGRGSHTEIGTYMDGVKLESEVAGNVADLCPVGALTSKPNANMLRPWEGEMVKTLDVTDAARNEVNAHVVKNYVHRILPVKTPLTNGYLHDKGRYAFDSLTHEDRIFFPSQIMWYGHGTAMSIPMTWDTCARLLEDVVGYKESDRISVRRNDPASMKDLQGSYEMSPLKRESQKIGGAHRLDVLLGPWTSLEAAAYWCMVRTKLEEWGLGHMIKLESLSADMSKMSGHAGARRYDAMFDFEALMEADLFVVVGMDLRAEAPMLNMVLRDKFLRGAAKVFVVGGNSDLTFPVLQTSVSIPGLVELTELDHPVTVDIYDCKRPMILTSGSLLRRPDADGLMDVLRLWSDMIKDAHRSFAYDRPIEQFPETWKVLNVYQPSGLGLASRQLGIGSFGGFEKPGSSVRSVLRMVGMDRGDLEQGHWGFPHEKAYAAIVTASPFLDMSFGPSVKMALPMTSHREEKCHLMSIDGGVRTSYAADMLARDSMTYQSFQLVLECFLPEQSFFFGSVLQTSLESIVRGVTSLTIPLRAHEHESASAGVGEKLVGLLDVPVEPIVNSYYLEGSMLARHSATMQKCYAEYEMAYDVSLVDKEFVVDCQGGAELLASGRMVGLADGIASVDNYVSLLGEKWAPVDETESETVNVSFGSGSNGVESVSASM